MDNQIKDKILWRHISSLPYFRGFLRAFEDYFYQSISLEEPILDLGSGDGHFASVAFNQKLDVGIDPWVAPTMEAQKRDTYGLLVLGEGAHLPFDSNTFATVISTSVLEHIKDIDPVLVEAQRILKPGGRFIFCGPNQHFPEKLWGRGFFDRLGLRKLGIAYSRFFNRISRHYHTDAPEVWKFRLENTGYTLLETWNYFPPKALHILEWGHPLGLPALLFKITVGRWILVPKRWNLAIPWKMTRKYLDQPTCPEGVCSFYIAQKII
ncbi:MAG: class I SAM-dependent methyltransferase [Anaerolineales bacterium]